MDKKQICKALRRWISQRPGLEFDNYGNFATYRSEMRSITKDMHHAQELLRAVELSGITADALREAFRNAYSGRLSLVERDDGAVALEYCTGQYWPTEYRAAACAVLSSALWSYKRENMPAPDRWRVESYGKWNGNAFEHERSRPMQLHAACDLLAAKGGRSYGFVQEYRSGKSPVDWLRASFRREFGRGIASRWFN